MTEVRRSLPELRQRIEHQIRMLTLAPSWSDDADMLPLLRDLLAVLPDACLPLADPSDENRPGDPAEDLRDEITVLTRERDEHLAAWREQDEALQRIVGESGYDITITCSNDVADLVQRERAEYEDTIRRLRSVLPETPESQGHERDNGDPFRWVKETFPSRGRCQWHDTEYLKWCPAGYYCVLCALENKQVGHARPAREAGGKDETP